MYDKNTLYEQRLRKNYGSVAPTRQRKPARHAKTVSIVNIVPRRVAVVRYVEGNN